MAQATLLRIRDIAFLAVFDDSGAAASDRKDYLARITGEPSPIQLRELLGHLAYTNLALTDRARFFTYVDRSGLSICVNRPDQIFREPFDEEALGGILYSCVEEYLPKVRAENLDEIKSLLRKSRYTFLFDTNGNFMQDPLILEEDSQNAETSDRND